MRRAVLMICDGLRADLIERTRAALARHDLRGLMPVEIYEGSIGPRARAIGGASLPLLANFLKAAETSSMPPIPAGSWAGPTMMKSLCITGSLSTP